MLALVLAQLLLPGIAANRISSRLRRYGTVHSVRVSAWPAVELLWGDAHSVNVRAGEMKLTPAQTASLLWEARGAGRLQMSASSVREGSLALFDVRLSKSAGQLSAEASTTESDVRAALPPGFGVQLLRSEGGSVEVRASGRLFGIDADLDAVAEPSGGALVVHPRAFPFEALGLTLFSDPHVYVEGVGASTTSAGAQPGYRLTMTARLR